MQAAAEWDRAWALYVGWDQSCSPAGTANKRGKNFDTLVPSSTYGDEKVANREIRVWHGATEKGP